MRVGRTGTAAALGMHNDHGESNIFIYICVCVCACVCVCIDIYIYTICIYMCVYIYTHTHAYMCIYIYTYICKYVYVYMYSISIDIDVYIYTENGHPFRPVFVPTHRATAHAHWPVQDIFALFFVCAKNNHPFSTPRSFAVHTLLQYNRKTFTQYMHCPRPLHYMPFGNDNIASNALSPASRRRAPARLRQPEPRMPASGAWRA